MAIVDGHIRCGACGERKPADAFYPSIAARGNGRCRACARAAYRESAQRDPGRFAGYRRASKARNPAGVKAAMKRWMDKKKALHQVNPTTEGTIRCSSCHEEKRVDQFQPSVVARGSGPCRACKYEAKRDYERRNSDKVNAGQRRRRQQRDPEEHRARMRQHYRKNREAYRGYALQRYGLTPADYDAMLAAQGGCCACCGVKANRNGKRLFVDHDHVTGAVRGILCTNCNRGIGALGDNAAGVRRALDYLERATRSPQRAQPTMRINLLSGVN